MLLVELAYVIDALIECTFCRNRFKSHVDHLCRIVALESCRVEVCCEYTTIETVTAVHDVTHLVSDLHRLRDHGRSHETDEVSLDLEVEVVGVRVVEPVT